MFKTLSAKWQNKILLFFYLWACVFVISAMTFEYWMVEDCKRGCFVSIKIILVESNEIDGTDDMDYVQMCVLNSFLSPFCS